MSTAAEKLESAILEQRHSLQKSIEDIRCVLRRCKSILGDHDSDKLLTPPKVLLTLRKQLKCYDDQLVHGYTKFYDLVKKWKPLNLNDDSLSKHDEYIHLLHQCLDVHFQAKRVAYQIDSQLDKLHPTELKTTPIPMSLSPLTIPSGRNDEDLDRVDDWVHVESTKLKEPSLSTNSWSRSWPTMNVSTGDCGKCESVRSRINKFISSLVGSKYMGVYQKPTAILGTQNGQIRLQWLESALNELAIT